MNLFSLLRHVLIRAEQGPGVSIKIRHIDTVKPIKTASLRDGLLRLRLSNPTRQPVMNYRNVPKKLAVNYRNAPKKLVVN